MSKAKVRLLLEMLDEMWEGYGWIDPLRPALEGWSDEQAKRPFAHGVKSVETIVNHTAFWEELALRGLTGRTLADLGPPSAAQEGESPACMPAWPQAADNFRKIRAELRVALQACHDEQLTELPPGEELTREVRLYTRAIHGSYHAGQLVLLQQLFQLPPPPIATPVSGAKPPLPFVGARHLLLDMMDSAWTSGYSIVPFEELIAEVSIEQANRRQWKKLHTITEIVNHMTFWEEYVTRRLKGEGTEEMPVVAAGAAAPGMPGWPRAGEHLIEQHSQLRAILETLGDEELSRPRPGHGKRFEVGHAAQWLVYGIVTHHAYHVGQLVMLAQLAGE